MIHAKKEGCMTRAVTKVSVIIPTTGRPTLQAAIDSALAQPEASEVIVVADVLDLPPLGQDSRLIVMHVGPKAGGNVARMAGIKAAKSDIVALLDDDDYWYPTKLAEQLKTVAANREVSQGSPWISSAAVSRPGFPAWPLHFKLSEESIGSYLFKKKSLRAGQGAMHTSTLMFPKHLAETTELDTKLRFHQDIDWLIRVSREHKEIAYLQTPKPLVFVTEDASSVSQNINPMLSYRWGRMQLRDQGPHVTGDFTLTVPYYLALRQRKWGTAITLAARAVILHRPTLFGLSSVILLPTKLLLRLHKNA